jgi:hypothetical protein
MGATPYFERALPVGLIFGSFFVLFVPLLALQLIPNYVDWLPYLSLAEAVGLGTSHFLITLAVYLEGENLRYFARSLKNRLIYFAVPLMILTFFGLSAATDLRARAPVFSMYLFGGLRFFDFFHVGRQSVGMMQIWKRGAPQGLPSWLRRAENAFFVGMAGLQWETFALGGRFAVDRPHALLPALVLALLFVVVLVNYLQRPLNGAARPYAMLAPSYFVMQAACAAAAVYETRLYLVALTLHYVEYHVIMAPRCLRLPGTPARAANGRESWMLDRPWLFYATLLALTVLFELRNATNTHSPAGAFFVHVFDGIFLLHYFVEAFLWKFGNPYYREALAPLYFGTGPSAHGEPISAAHRHGLAGALLGRSRPTAFGLCLFTAGALMFGGLVQSQGWWHGFTAGVQQRVIDPVHVENHVRWGRALAQRGQLMAARKHLLSALLRNERDPDARALLQWVDAAMRRARPGD